MSLRVLALVAVLTAVSVCALSAAEISLPLGNLSPGSTTAMEQPRDTYDLKLKHLVPGAIYTYAVATRYEALQAPQAPAPTPPVGDVAPPLCEQVLFAYEQALSTATTEEDVERFERNARGSAATDISCLERIDAVIDARTLTFTNAFTVRRKFVSEITVRRNKNNDERTWTVEVRTGPGAVWTTMSVLAAVLDEGERYFTESAPLTNANGTTEERFRLVREDHGLDLRPGAGAGFFLVPEKQRERNLAHTFMAGFGLTDSKIPLFGMIGYGMLVGDHVSITLGAAMTLERHLLRRYRGEEFISENLTSDQLTGEDLVFRPFLSIGIDFNGFDLGVGKKSPPPEEP